MYRQDITSNLIEGEALRDKGRLNDAMDLLQAYINAPRLESKEFMERLRDETKNPQVLDILQQLYFLNFV